MTRGGVDKPWSPMPYSIVRGEDDYFLEADIYHFSNFGPAVEIGKNTHFTRGSYVTERIPRRGLSRREGLFRFVNASDKTVTFCLMPQMFEDGRSRSLGVGVPNVAFVSATVERQRSGDPAGASASSISLESNEWNDVEISEFRGSRGMVGVSTRGDPDGDGKRKLFIWDSLAMRHKMALTVLKNRFADPIGKPPNHGELDIERDAKVVRIVCNTIAMLPATA